MARLWRKPGCRSSDSRCCADNGPWLTMRLAGGSAGLLRDGKSTTWEGGIREPGIIHWPGKIKPGISTAVAATYDIFSTSLALAGVAEPSDRFIDGVDLSPVLFEGAEESAHKCLFHCECWRLLSSQGVLASDPLLCRRRVRRQRNTRHRLPRPRRPSGDGLARWDGRVPGPVDGALRRSQAALRDQAVGHQAALPRPAADL